jgi:hypothetical protein
MVTKKPTISGEANRRRAAVAAAKSEGNFAARRVANCRYLPLIGLSNLD